MHLSCWKSGLKHLRNVTEQLPNESKPLCLSQNKLKWSFLLLAVGEKLRPLIFNKAGAHKQLMAVACARLIWQRHKSYLTKGVQEDSDNLWMKAA